MPAAGQARQGMAAVVKDCMDDLTIMENVAARLIAGLKPHVRSAPDLVELWDAATRMERRLTRMERRLKAVSYGR